jgi:hypothetical protein
MGRELKRVPLHFEWPINKVWKGFKNPHYDGHCSNCPDCNGRGSTLAQQRLEDLVSLLMLSADDAVRGKVHPYFTESPLYSTQGIAVSLDIVELTGGLAGRPHRTPFGHDACDRWAAVKKIIAAAGLKKSWGTCKTCNGEGSVWDTPENKRLAARWRSKQPPKGKGYQIWETVSEGSPVSPVFGSPEELADWMCLHDDSVSRGTTREQWLQFINGPGWAMTMMSSPTGGSVVGVQAVAD